KPPKPKISTIRPQRSGAPKSVSTRLPGSSSARSPLPASLLVAFFPNHPILAPTPGCNLCRHTTRRISHSLGLCGLQLLLAQGFQYLVACAVHGECAISQHQQLVYGTQDAHAMGDDDHGGATCF